MLFDLQNDPEEFHDLGQSEEHAEIVDMMYKYLGKWGRRMSQRTTKSEKDIINMRGASRRKGIVLGTYDGSEVDPEWLVKYRGKAKPRPAKKH